MIEIDDIESTEITDRMNLATIEFVTALEPMEGKDRIEFIRCQGYAGVVQKGLHTVGDLVLVVKYETVLPEIPMFEFMRDSKFRVKSKSFNTTNGKVYSQIIVIPLGEVKSHIGEDILLEEGTDLTTILGVKKYIPPVKNGGKTSFGVMQAKGDFPTMYINKTDETNVQGALKVLEELKGLPYSITYKHEGSSMSSLIRPNEQDFVVCSRNNMLKENELNSFWYAARKFKFENFHKMNPNIAIQSELCGMMPDGSNKIQGNVMGLDDIYPYVFNMVYLDNRKYVDFHSQVELCLLHKLPHVSIVETGDSFDYSFKDLMDMVVSLRYPFGNNQIVEGIVIRPIEHVHSQRLQGPLSFKLKNPEYDLKKLTSGK